MPARQTSNPTYSPTSQVNEPSGNKTLPQNIEAERSVLAVCLLNEEAVTEAVTRLKPGNFFRPAHRIIFEGILNLNVRNIPVDQISLAENLQGSGQLEAVGGKAYLIELADNTFALTNWQNHIEIVKRTSILRELVYASAQIKALAYEAPDDMDLIVEEAEKALFAVTEKRISSDFVSIRDLADQAYAEIVEMADRKSHMVGVPTGFEDVDKLFHGFRGGDLVILAARPGVGKTSFALNLAVNSAKAGVSVAFLSLEMSSMQLMQRILCAEAAVNLSRLRSGAATEENWKAIVNASSVLADLDFYIDDTPSLSILELRAKARRELRDKKQGLIVVDYLQLMQPPRQRSDGNRATEVAEISRGLKILAKEMNMPVIALSQLSRQVEMRGNRRPMLSDLRESGSIEQDADIVMFIDRSTTEEEAEKNDRPDMGIAELIVAKHRNGPIDTIKLTFNAGITSFKSYYDDSRAGAF